MASPDSITCIVDSDADGYGTEVGTQRIASDGSCDPEDQESYTADDCNDTIATIHPGGWEQPDDEQVNADELCEEDREFHPTGI